MGLMKPATTNHSTNPFLFNPIRLFAQRIPKLQANGWNAKTLKNMTMEKTFCHPVFGCVLTESNSEVHCI